MEGETEVHNVTRLAQHLRPELTEPGLEPRLALPPGMEWALTWSPRDSPVRPLFMHPDAGAPTQSSLSSVLLLICLSHS